MESIKKKIGKKLVEIRTTRKSKEILKGLTSDVEPETIVSISKKTGLSMPTLRNIENGDIGYNINTLLVLLDYYDISIKSFFSSLK